MYRGRVDEGGVDVVPADAPPDAVPVAAPPAPAKRWTLSLFNIAITRAFDSQSVFASAESRRVLLLIATMRCVCIKSALVAFLWLAASRVLPWALLAGS